MQLMFESIVLAIFISSASGDTQCLELGGTCVDWRYYKCSAGVETGLCLGDANRRCCLKCDSLCMLAEQEWAACCDSSCTSGGGVCQDNTNYCSSEYAPGQCGGPSERQCCGGSPGGGGENQCPLITYSTPNVKGYAGLKFKIESTFRPSIDLVDEAAVSCDVMVYVTHAFRHEGQGNTGTVRPPTTTSNHVVGHAIDFNLETPKGWCDGECINDGGDSFADCFIRKVKESGLHWGGEGTNPDPVHIDDRLYLEDLNAWQSLYYELQAVC